MAQPIAALAERLTGALGSKILSITTRLGEVTAAVDAANLLEVATVLRDHPELRFEQLIDLCGVDYAGYGKVAWSGTPMSEGGAGAPLGGAAPETDSALPLAETPPFPPAAPDRRSASGRARFAVVYHLLSLTHNWRLRLRTFAADAEFPVVDSVIDIWPSANWFEREAFDLYGIVFSGHLDLRRILTDYGFIGHPFRKDFPLSGNVEMRYDPDQQRVIYQPVTIEPREIVPRIVREEHYADSEGFRKG